MKKLVIDASAMLWKALYAGKDDEYGREVPHPSKEGKVVWINSAGFGFENFVNLFVAALDQFKLCPKDAIFVFDGKGAKGFRQEIYPEYKAGREHAAAGYEEFQKLVDMVKKVAKSLGSTIVYQDRLEADDVIAYLARTMGCETIIASNDGDLLSLVNERVHVWTGEDYDVNKYGLFSHKYITVYKALVGDSSDNIKGAHGFGAKAFLQLLMTFDEDGLDLMEQLIREKRLPELAEDVPQMKKLQNIIDGADSVYQSYQLARFYDDKVNTKNRPLQIEPGMVELWDPNTHDLRLKQWYGQALIATAYKYDQACRWALPKLLDGEEVFLDIETSSLPESDEWMAQRKRSTDDDSDLGVDVLGHRLTSLQLTFGSNNQFTLYFPVDNKHTANCTSEQVRKFMELIPHSKPIVIQNVNFEMPILYLEWGEAWKDNPEHGFLVNTIDTKLMASYVDENERTGLKERSLRHLGYEQTSYSDLLKQYDVKKMNQLTAEQAFDYSIDDTRCTAALHNYYRLVMELEHTWDAFTKVEVDASYLFAYSFVRGIPFSLQRMRELEDEDKAAYTKSWAVVQTYLRAAGWPGTVQPLFEPTAARIKELYRILTNQLEHNEPDEGYDDAFLKSRVRTPAKLALLAEELNQATFASLVTAALAGDTQSLDGYIKLFFTGEPAVNMSSPKQMQKLLYETIGLPIRLRNKPTDTMREKNVFEGTPSTDALAIQYALLHDCKDRPELVEVLRAMQAMQICATREKLYYKPYPFMLHWSDNKLHPNIQQSAQATRRNTARAPNVTQLPKHPKATGEPAKFRECFPPHKRGAVVYPPDFSAQELRSIAEYSQDTNMLACFVGESKKDMHALTAVGIANTIGARPQKATRWLTFMLEGSDVESLRQLAKLSYEEFEVIRKNGAHPLYGLFEKGLRPLGKKTNFTTEYGAMAPKLARTLICELEEAQEYIDAKLAMFPQVEVWKKETIAFLHEHGYATTMMGARRHLAGKLTSGKGFEIGKAERQAVNYRIQGSCGEQTKIAMGRVWRSSVLFRYDSEFYMPSHDELVFSVVGEHAVPFIKESNALMTMQYANQKVPVIASISVGPNYGQQVECGDEFDADKVAAGVAKALGSTVVV